MWLVPDAAGQFDDPYSFGNDPINSLDEDGNWAFWDDVAAIGLGAVAGYVGYGLQTGNWLSVDALAMAAVGAAAGDGALYTGGATLSALAPLGVTGVGATVAAGAAGGAVGGGISGLGGYSVGASAPGQSWNIGDAVKATGLGVAAGMVGGAAGGGSSQLLGQYIASPVLRGTIGGALGGYAGGVTGGLLSGGSLGQANLAGLSGLALGAGMGAVAGPTLVRK